MSWERTRSFFPVTRTLAYLNHAGVAPISTRVAEALARYSAEATDRGAFDYQRSYDAEVERVRGRAARLLGAGIDEIAFAKNTSEGLGMVAAGLDWQRGDRVVTCDLEYPSNVYAWWNLRPHGVETVMLRSRDGRLPLESVEEALRHPRTRLLALSSVEFGSGARNDLPTLGRLCRERGVLFCVDAIQSLGCFPLDVAECHVDFLAADGHKWLLSVEGCGLFFCRRALLARARAARGRLAQRHRQSGLRPLSPGAAAGCGPLRGGHAQHAGHLRAGRRDRSAARARSRGDRPARARAHGPALRRGSRSAAPRSRARARRARPPASSPSGSRTRRRRRRWRVCARRACSWWSGAAACAHRPTSTTRPEDLERLLNHL